MKYPLLFLLFLFSELQVTAEDEYNLWLRYTKSENPVVLKNYEKLITSPAIIGVSCPVLIVKEELRQGLGSLTGIVYSVLSVLVKNFSLVISVASTNAHFKKTIELEKLGREGIVIKNNCGKTGITANMDIGALYDVFHFLILLQTQQDISNLNIVYVHNIKLRLLNHWNNLNQTIERDYADFSLLDWHRLSAYVDKRYIDYARANTGSKFCF